MNIANRDRLIKARKIKNLKKELSAAALAHNFGLTLPLPPLDIQIVFCNCKTQMMRAEATWNGANELLCKICAISKGLLSVDECDEDTVFVKLMMDK